MLVNIVGLLVDNRRVEFGSQFGTEVLLLECKKYDQDAIVISIDSGHTISLKLGEIKKCSLFKLQVLWFSFVFLKRKVSVCGKYCQVLSLIFVDPDMDALLGRIGRESLGVFTDFVSSQGVRLTTVNSLIEIDSQIRGFKIGGCEAVRDLLISTLRFLDQCYNTYKIDCDATSKTKVFQALAKGRHERFYRSYVNFLNTKSWSDRDFKTYMRSLKNLPKFFKEVLGTGSSGKLWVIVEYFICEHRCRRCHKLTYLKCSFCKYSHYCSKQCQIEDWPSHKIYCPDIETQNMELESSTAVFHTLIRKQLNYNNGESLLTLEVFMQEIERVLFTAYLSVIEDTNFFDEGLSRDFGTTCKRIWMNSLKSQSRRRYKNAKISATELEAQMIDAFGSKARFSKPSY